MKRCDYCGKESEESAAYCTGCGTSFLPLPESGLGTLLTGEFLSLKLRFSMLMLSWLTFWVAISVPHVLNPVGVPYVLMLFPMILCGLLTGAATNPWVCFVAVVLVGTGYLALSWECLVERRRVRFLIVYAVLCGLLILNAIVGRLMFHY